MNEKSIVGQDLRHRSAPKNSTGIYEGSIATFPFLSENRFNNRRTETNFHSSHAILSPRKFKIVLSFF